MNIPSRPFRKFGYTNGRLAVGELLTDRDGDDYHHLDLLSEAAAPDKIDWQDRAAGWIVGEGSDLIYDFGPFADERSPVALAAEELNRWAKEAGVRLQPATT